MEEIKCILCNKKNFKYLFKTKDFNYGFKGEFKVIRCKNCKLVFLNPRPTVEEMSYFYDSDYLEVENIKKDTRFQEEVKINQLEKIKRMERICKNKGKIGKILDIGCGRGEFLYYLKERGWDTYGVEKLNSAVLFAQEKLKLNIFCGDLLDTNFPSNYFDVVSLWHVLEHLHYPIETLVKINKILKPEGILIIACPNIDSFQAKISKDKWYLLDAPRHLFSFSPQTLKMILKKTGFYMFHISYCGEKAHNLSGMRLSLKRKYSIFQRKKRLFDMLLYRGSIFLENLMIFLKTGGAIEVYSKKLY